MWNTICVAAEDFYKKGWITEIWYPKTAFESVEYVIAVELSDIYITGLHELLKTRNLNPESNIIFTHGAWRFATKWGAALKKLGFKWMYTPHGMLEPWPLKHKWLKKLIYLNLFEQRMARTADIIRAVSSPEKKNLARFFPKEKIQFIANGIRLDVVKPNLIIEDNVRRYVFLSRLHKKKNIVTLTEAWKQSSLANNSSAELLIIGPDEGELILIKNVLQEILNIKYLGSIYGDSKNEILRRSIFYVLPSFSEGLPSSLLEAMEIGLIPIVTIGCNFPELFSQDLGVEIKTDVDHIRKVLEATFKWEKDKIIKYSIRGRSYVKEHFSIKSHTEKVLTSLNLN
ncbi:MAG: glycosyltransferase [Chitinophagaceae bacterium]|nr:glycosyltransferase [Chitinophagaceae bacterium]